MQILNASPLNSLKVFLKLLNRFWFEKGHRSQTFFVFHSSFSIHLNNVAIIFEFMPTHKQPKKERRPKRLSFGENNRQSFSDEIFPLLVACACASVCARGILSKTFGFVQCFRDNLVIQMANGNGNGKGRKMKAEENTNMTKWKRKRSEANKSFTPSLKPN